MSLRLDELLQACTVKIKISKTSHGTGFFFVPKLILTCNHVVKEKAIGEFVEVTPYGYDYSIQAQVKHRFSQEIDLAILQIYVEDSFPCVYIGTEIKPRDSCYAYGYTDDDKGFSLGDPVTLECEGITGGEIQWIKLKGGQVRPGLSGSPLLNQSTGKVCGVVKFSRHRKSDLGGGAVPVNIVFSEFKTLEEVHNDFHKSDTRWSQLLDFDAEAFDSDWTYLDWGWQRFNNYIKALVFLCNLAIKWTILGFYAPRAFPLKTVGSLIEHTFKGDLGQEIKRQHKKLTQRLCLEVDLEGCEQAKILNELDSQAGVLTKLIEMLITEEQDLASTSRLLWVTEVLHEQRNLIDELKKNDGNSYPKLEAFRKKWKIFNDRENDSYTVTDRILSKLVIRHTNTNYALWHSLEYLIGELIAGIQEYPKLNLIYIEKLCTFLTIHITYFIPSSDFSIEALLSDLEKEIKRYPKLKVLKKIKIIVEAASGELVQGGFFRAWSEKRTYHFSRQCKYYPERVKPEEMDKILCYNTREEAERKHKPCKTCLDFEGLSNDDIELLGDEPTID
ncbi:MAG: serine protease [Limnoraphis sp.]